MGSIFSGIGSLFSGGGGSRSSGTSSSGSIGGLAQNAFLQEQLAGQLDTQGNQIFGPAFGQYNAGINDVLTPSQQSLVDQNLGTMDTATRGTYGDLGLGGSTMEGQDVNANALRSMAEKANLSFLNEDLGLKGLQEALGYFGGSESALGGSSASLGSAGQLQNEQQRLLNQSIASLGNKSASGLGSGVQSLFGGGSGPQPAPGGVTDIFPTDA